MARQISELHSLNLYQIIGAPLLALVQAETQAVQATAEFIERVGFKKAGTPDELELTESDNFGDLRMITFRHQRLGVDGTPQTFNVEVPLLSLVPIPILQIKDAELEFFAKITDIQTGPAATAVSEKPSEKPADASDFLSRDRVEFRAAMGKMDTGNSGRMNPGNSDRVTKDTQMKMKITVEQADIPAGLSKLFNLMDQSVKGSLVEEQRQA